MKFKIKHKLLMVMTVLISLFAFITSVGACSFSSYQPKCPEHLIK